MNEASSTSAGLVFITSISEVMKDKEITLILPAQ